MLAVTVVDLFPYVIVCYYHLRGCMIPHDALTQHVGRQFVAPPETEKYQIKSTSYLNIHFFTRVCYTNSQHHLATSRFNCGGRTQAYAWVEPLIFCKPAG